MKKRDAKVLNIAGNGIYTLKEHDISQQDCNILLYKILLQVTMYYPIEKVISGGQTGIDWAGLVAATALGIEAEATYPKGFILRRENGVDVTNDPVLLQKEIESQAFELDSKIFI